MTWEALKIADRICIMKDGEIVQIDRHEQILLHPKNEFVRQFIGEDRLHDTSIFPELDELIVQPVTAHPSRGLAEALKIMRQKRVDNPLITDRENKYYGVVNIWDMRREFGNENLTLKDIMKSDIPTISPNESPKMHCK
jgi:osmoprotectant transport system ATP-binding protein